MSDYTVRIKRYEPTDPRLGRHVRHDSRSLNYLAPESDLSTLSSVKHQRYVPVFDQGQLGSCTGNAATGCAATSLLWTQPVQDVLKSKTADQCETYAVDVYSAATQLDDYQGSYPPNDTGSDGLSVAKVLQKRGLISGYTHATSLNAVLTALAKQPVIVGTEWRQDMFDPGSDGRLKITGSVAGGHEYVLDELDVEHQLIGMQNSWNTTWGVEGRAYYTWDDFGTLLAADGDCTIFTPALQPAPVPTPPPGPVPVPGDPVKVFKDASAEWLKVKHRTANNVTYEKAVKIYLGTL